MPSQRFGFPQLAAIALAAAAVMPVFAQQQQTNTIFPTGWDSNVRSRLFMRIGYTTAFTRTKSEDARDITGFAASRQDVADAFARGLDISASCNGTGTSSTYSAAECARYDDFSGGDPDGNWGFTGRLIDGAFVDDGVGGIGTPPGVRARAQKTIGTPTISLGYWLDEQKKWLLEGFVLAKPMKVKIYGDGYRQDGSANSINGKHIATTQLLPPLVIGSYNFGDANTWPVRPYVGLGVMYAVFFGAKTTAFFDSYLGGPSTIVTKNVFGAGPFVGIQAPVSDSFHVNLSVGQIGLRSTSRITTSNTSFKAGALVYTDLTKNLSEQIVNGDGLTAGAIGNTSEGISTLVNELIARNKGQANLGTFVREQKMKITNTIVTVSVGYNF